MTGITELGYVRFGVSNLAEWREFACDLIGLEAGDDSEKGRLYLRADLWHHRILLEEDGSDDLIGIGLRVAGREEFREMQAVLKKHKVPFKVAKEAVAKERRVLELMTLSDPAGNPLEIFHGPLIDTHRPFHPGRGMYGKFVTGEGGVGHMAIKPAKLDAMYDFYRMLGMRGGIEYRFPVGGDSTLDILFMHCNKRDHTFAIGRDCDKHIHHFMLEVDNLDDVFLAQEKVKEKYPILVSLGKHSNDHMLSFYCASPSGFLIEIGWGGQDAAHQSEYYTADTYGHERAASLK